METSLHRELKRLYAGDGARTEVVVERYRIDAVRDGQLIEIQHGSLAAIRDKIRRLVDIAPRAAGQADRGPQTADQASRA